MGGGTRNRLLISIKAALARSPLVVLDEPEAVSLGAALLGGVAAGVYDDCDAGVAAVEPEGRIVEADPDLVRAYGRLPWRMPGRRVRSPPSGDAMSAYYDLGDHGRAVTTASPQAQLWFDRGLAWTWGFNHDEAVACFSHAREGRSGLRHGLVGHRPRPGAQLQQALGRLRRGGAVVLARDGPRGRAAGGRALPRERERCRAGADPGPDAALPLAPGGGRSRLLERRLRRRHARGPRGPSRGRRHRGVVRRSAHEPHALGAVGAGERRRGRGRRHGRSHRGPGSGDAPPGPGRPRAASGGCCTSTSTRWRCRLIPNGP